jgi:hypothetical protein
MGLFILITGIYSSVTAFDLNGETWSCLFCGNSALCLHWLTLYAFRLCVSNRQRTDKLLFSGYYMTSTHGTIAVTCILYFYVYSADIILAYWTRSGEALLRAVHAIINVTWNRIWHRAQLPSAALDCELYVSRARICSSCIHFAHTRIEQTRLDNIIIATSPSQNC